LLKVMKAHVKKTTGKLQWDYDEIRFVLEQHVLAHWNNIPRVDISLHSDTLFWFRANQSLLFLLHAVCLAEKHAKQQLLNHSL
jgi:hypothetical protein